jgi:cellulose biosynthesis protein BcsQ
MPKNAQKNIAIVQLKGGEGKTTLAVMTAMMLQCGIVTNERHSPLDQAIPANRIVKLEHGEEMPEFPPAVRVVFDMAGFEDPRLLSALRQSSVCLVPASCSFLSLQRTLDTLGVVSGRVDRIAVVANRLESKYPNHAQKIEKVVHAHFPHVQILPLRRSSIVDRIFMRKESIQEIMVRPGLLSRSYQGFYEEYKKILDFINH